MPRTDPQKRPLLPMLAMIAGMIGIVGALSLSSRYMHGSKTPVIPEFSTEQLENFNFDQTNGTTADIPEEFRKLNGQRVKIIGEMWAGGMAADPVRDFDLLKKIRLDRHAPPMVQQFIKCHSAAPIPYLDGQVLATGVLHVEAKRGEAGIESIYQLDIEKVEAVSAGSPLPPTFYSPPGATTRPGTPSRWWYVVSIGIALPVLFASRYMRYRWRMNRLPVRARCLRCGFELRTSTDQCSACGSTFLEVYSPGEDKTD